MERSSFHLIKFDLKLFVVNQNIQNYEKKTM